MRNALVCLAVAAALPTFAQAAREGTVDMKLCFGGTRHVMTASPTDRFGSFVVKGKAESREKAFESFAVECTGAFEARSSGYQHKSYCIYKDIEGDTLYGVDFDSPQVYAWQFLGGTGKFAGISGTGTVEKLAAPQQTGDNGFQACRRVTGSYALP